MKNIIASKGALKHDDYGARYSKESTFFRLWAPACSGVKLALYADWNDYQRDEYPMEHHSDGTWSLRLHGDHAGAYYNYIIEHDENDIWLEVVDPYATGSAPNSRKAMIVDHGRTQPEGWAGHPTPPPVPLQNALLYELHVRDYTVSADSGISNDHKGLYLGLTETGTKLVGLSTGLDHLKELGVTHVHLMPVFDFKSVDEVHRTEYNWGYDPALFNVPEGSYATTPQGHARILEFKQMVQTLHEHGLRVIMDVVYNHTFQGEDSNFNRLVPGYYYRTKDGYFTNGSGCGNELDTEKPMTRKFILDSLKYWMTTYRIDGFRFDLMGLYDVETMQCLGEELRAIDPDVLLYGEPWTGGDSGLSQERMFLKGRQKGTGIAMFNDSFRDAIKGDNDGHGRGVVNGHMETQDLYDLRRGICGEIDYSKEICGFASQPTEAIQYICAHDNLILRDKIEKVTQSFDSLYLTRINRLAFTIMLTAFGIPFLHEGTELYRSKLHNHNSYNAPDHINEVKWSNKEKYYPLFVFVKNLIAFRRTAGVFDQTAAEIRKHLCFHPSKAKELYYTIVKGEEMYHFHHNYGDEPLTVQVPPDAVLFVLNDQCVPDGFRFPKDTMSVAEVENKCSLIYRIPKPRRVSKNKSTPKKTDDSRLCDTLFD